MNALHVLSGRTGALAISVAAVATLASGASGAAELMPSFAGAPTGWVTDRYAPTVFADIGTFQGRSNVLEIGITSAGNLANRPSAYQSTFYNTQGKQTAISGGAGSTLSADLYIPTAWADAANGSVRTDMWGVMVDGTPTVSDYPIIGFTNYGGARLRVWDDSGWHDLGTAINYDAWNSLSIAFTGGSYQFSVNGSVVYTDGGIDGSVAFSAAIMQAYNFADPSITGANAVDYSAHWANVVAVPEPEAYALALAGFAVVGAFGARRRARTRH